MSKRKTLEETGKISITITHSPLDSDKLSYPYKSKKINGNLNPFKLSDRKGKCRNLSVIERGMFGIP